MNPYGQLIVAVIFLAFAALAWLSSVFHLPGNWIIFLLALLYGWSEGFNVIPLWVLGVGLGLCALGELFELLTGFFGARAFGGSRWSGLFAVAGAILGALFGAAFGYGLGAIPGTVLGAFLGALASELVRQKHAGKAIMAGFGAALGRAAGLAGKLACGGAFLALLWVRVIWMAVQSWDAMAG